MTQCPTLAKIYTTSQCFAATVNNSTTAWFTEFDFMSQEAGVFANKSLEAAGVNYRGFQHNCYLVSEYVDAHWSQFALNQHNLGWLKLATDCLYTVHDHIVLSLPSLCCVCLFLFLTKLDLLVPFRSLIHVNMSVLIFPFTKGHKGKLLFQLHLWIKRRRITLGVIYLVCIFQ